MLTVAAFLLALTAVVGLTTAATRTRSGANPPLPMALIHGALGASGLVISIIAGLTDGFSSRHGISTGLLVVAALGGFILFSSHLRDRLISLPVTIVHALIAVIGYGLLVSEALA